MLAIECQSGLVYKLAGGCIVEYSTFETYECSVGLGTVVWDPVHSPVFMRVAWKMLVLLSLVYFSQGRGRGGTIRDMG